jgi:hypothetical protein
VTHEDWDLKIRLTKRFQAAYCPEPLSEYRRHENSLSSLPAALRLNSVKQVYRKNVSLLKQLPRSDRRFVKRKVRVKFAKLARKAAWEEFETGQWGLARRHWLEAVTHWPRIFDLRLATRIWVPWAF